MTYAQGKCSGPPPAALTAEGLRLRIAKSEPWVAPRCVLVSDEDVFLLDRPGLWLDSLHIQLVSATDNDDTGPMAVYDSGGGLLFISNTAIQGDQDTDAIGLRAIETGGALVRGELLPNLQLRTMPAEDLRSLQYV